jgi:hypothetical protein
MCALLRFVQVIKDCKCNDGKGQPIECIMVVMMTAIAAIPVTIRTYNAPVPVVANTIVRDFMFMSTVYNLGMLAMLTVSMSIRISIYAETHCADKSCAKHYD